MLKCSLSISDILYYADLEQPISIGIPIKRKSQPNAFYLSSAVFSTVEAGSFVGNVSRGGSCNCEDITFNPHGNGTHTECAGHISKEEIFVSNTLTKTHFLTKLITCTPFENQILVSHIEKELSMDEPIEALVIRTLPNDTSKMDKHYSGTLPAYFHPDTIRLFNQHKIKHILTDLPSLDSENDPDLTCHKIFFQKVDGLGWDKSKTITEMIYVPDNVANGLYLLDLQIAPFESDAAPSVPLLYELTN